MYYSNCNNGLESLAMLISKSANHEGDPMIKDIATKCRSYRRFYQDQRIDESMLRDWVDTIRYTASSCNGQPLKYKFFCTPEDCAKIFPNTAWAGALPDWDGPEEGERPAAYIVILRDEELSIADKFTAWDEGIVAQTIMLAATETGFGGCMIGSFKKGSVAEICGVKGTNLSPDLILALGAPKEEVHIVEVGEDGSTKYYRDENQVHYVPKRALEGILL